MLAQSLFIVILHTVHAGNFSLHFLLPSSAHLDNSSLSVSSSISGTAFLATRRLHADHDRHLELPFEAPARYAHHLRITLTRRGTTAYTYRLQMALTSAPRIVPISDKLTMSVALRCQAGFFGDECAVRCVADDRRRCDERGRAECTNGWTGVHCDRAVTPTTVVAPLKATTQSSTVVIIHQTEVDDRLFYGMYIGLLLILIAMLVMLYVLAQMSATFTSALARLAPRLSPPTSPLPPSNPPAYHSATKSKLPAKLTEDDNDSMLDSSYNSVLDRSTRYAFSGTKV